MPAFYHRPQTVDDIINQTVNRVLDLLDITLPRDLFRRWQGGRNGRDDDGRRILLVSGLWPIYLHH